MNKKTFILIAALILGSCHSNKDKQTSFSTSDEMSAITPDEQLINWVPPDTTAIPTSTQGDLIRYGKELIVHTAQYFGPNGIISQVANGLNCQNCHLGAGTRPFANNFSLVSTTYPKYRPRNDRLITIAMRINSCMKRSMNGEPLDSNSREVKAMIAYFDWLGKEVDESDNLFGTRTKKLAYLTRAADPLKGKQVFTAICQACHGKDGQGKWTADSSEYLYPPLWGTHSYNMGAGIYRIGKFASYVKNNMPFGTTYHYPILTDEQAWDVAAYVNSQPHPKYKGQSKDYLKLSDKPLDYPFGPYADTFSEKEHKYGPYKRMISD